MLEYTLPIWSHTATSSLAKLNIVQLCAVHMVIGAVRASPTAIYEQESDDQSFENQRRDQFIRYGNHLHALPECHYYSGLFKNWKNKSKLK